VATWEEEARLRQSEAERLRRHAEAQRRRRRRFDTGLFATSAVAAYLIIGWPF
jgi:hypothetical protein